MYSCFSNWKVALSPRREAGDGGGAGGDGGEGPRVSHSGAQVLPPGAFCWAPGACAPGVRLRACPGVGCPTDRGKPRS